MNFSLLLTANLDAGTPDEFIFSILDNTMSPLPTTSSSPLYPLLSIVFGSANPTITTFAGDFNKFPVAGGFAYFPAPVVTVVTAGIPEPSPAVLCVFPLALLILVTGRRLCQS